MPPTGYQITGSTFSSFSDDLKTTASFKKNWARMISSFIPESAPVAWQSIDIGLADDGINAWRWSFDGFNNPLTGLWTLGLPLPGMQAQGKNQFSQCQRVKVAAGAPYVIGGGVGVFMQLNQQDNTSGTGITGYILYTLSNNGGEMRLARCNASAIQDNFGGIGPFVAADGDVYRLEGRIVGATNKLTVKKNGVIQGVATDNTPCFPGVPTMSGSFPGGITGGSGAPKQHWRNYMCGVL